MGQTGNTETAAGFIAEQSGAEAEDFASYDGLIVGCPTWNTGADDYRSGTAWDDLLDEIKGVDLAGKPVAVFGCGDSQAYGDNFCDGIEELHETFKAAGAKMVGYVDASGYQHQESKSVRGDKFLGLPLDETTRMTRLRGASRSGSSRSRLKACLFEAAEGPWSDNLLFDFPFRFFPISPVRAREL